jgi:hypothetical protein
MHQQLDVVISVEGGQIQVNPDPFFIHKHADQVVRWRCTAGHGEFMVEFGEDSPFYEKQFTKDFPCSGLAKREITPDDHRIYKYTVRVGEHTLDPGGGVRK